MKDYPKNLFDVKKYVENIGIKCQSLKYINISDDMEWECLHNHKWNAPLREIIKKPFCPVCNQIEEINARYNSLQKIAKRKQGKCLSPQYINEQTVLLWKCRANHTWSALPQDIRKGNWCPYCEKLMTNPIKTLNVIAQGYGGQCLSTHYFDEHSNMKWSCALGDIWYTSAEKIKIGQWCPICQFFDTLQIIYLCDICKTWSYANPKKISTICPKCKTQIIIGNITGYEFVPNRKKIQSIIDMKNFNNEIPPGYISPYQIQTVDETHFFPELLKKITQILSSQANITKITIEYIHQLYTLYIPHFSQNLQSFGSFTRFMRYVANLAQREKNGWTISCGKGIRFKLKPIHTTTSESSPSRLPIFSLDDAKSTPTNISYGEISPILTKIESKYGQFGTGSQIIAAVAGCVEKITTNYNRASNIRTLVLLYYFSINRNQTLPKLTTVLQDLNISYTQFENQKTRFLEWGVISPVLLNELVCEPLH